MKVLLADKISETAKKILEDAGFEADLKPGLTEDELVSIIPEYDAMAVRSGCAVTKKIIDAGTKLKVIGRAGVGFNNIDAAAAKEKGIAVMNTPLGNVNAAAEHTVGMMIALARHIHRGHYSLKHKGEWERKKFTGIELNGRTLGIIGLGNVGKIVARIAKKGFGMKLIGFDPVISKEDARKVGVKLVEFDKLIKKSDFITVHVPLIDKTRNMIDKAQLEQMKDGVRIINVARGGIINEKALADALESGKVAGAAVDVWEEEPPFNSPLLKCEDCVFTPHLGASTTEAQEGVALDIAHQIIDALKEGILRNVVNGVTKLRE